MFRIYSGAYCRRASIAFALKCAVRNRLRKEAARLGSLGSRRGRGDVHYEAPSG